MIIIVAEFLGQVKYEKFFFAMDNSYFYISSSIVMEIF